MFTEDLIAEILLRLPVKSILRFKAVCKPWLSLISSPNFMKSQLCHSITRQGADQILVHCETDHYDDDLISPLHLESCQFGAPLGLPYSRGDLSFEPVFRIIGSCCGLVCIYVSNFPKPCLVDGVWRFLEINRNPDIYVWNPATKHSKLIQPPNICGDDILSVAMGFDFDPVSNGYKVLRVVSSYDNPFSAEVYSGFTNVWRKIDPNPTDFPDLDDFNVCVNGFLCFLGLHGIMPFDLDKEVFTCGVRLPARYHAAFITDFNNCIAFIDTVINESNNMIKLWTLDDEACLRDRGVEASWTLTLSLVVDLPVYCVSGYFNTGEFLLNTITEDEDDIWLLYNSNKKEARNVPATASIGSRQIYKYNESLVSVPGSTQVI